MLKRDKEKFEQFVNFLTINVSEFYRNPAQWDVLEKEVFPALIHRFGRSLRIWSAACSTGDEPYSLVMALSKYLPLVNIRVIATDIDHQVLNKARMGLYSEKSIVSVPQELKKRYFRKAGNEETRDAINQKFSASLVRGGILFIGSAEQIINYKQLGFQRKKSFFFQRE